ncbi:AMP-binding protein [Skermania sp. ID1734]|uniref:acyl-CoA synthetase n=1 Tax=Skermania sp. ID1734 TaxID=2597516 RepID=UPI00117E5C3F|nr:acyl-CoA synthetase [Skermania sp. ID1734]TSD98018.1 AMP-binding protein [Skermania sp. ID1734]
MGSFYPGGEIAVDVRGRECLVEIKATSLIGPLQRLVATAQNGLEVMRYGGLETGRVPAPFEIIERKPMYRLRRYFPDVAPGERPPLVLVPPMMLSADVYDVTQTSSAVTILHEHGIDPLVVDFGSPATEEGGLDRNLADHVVAVSEIVDTIRRYTGRDVHLGGYSQGGMFCYQSAAYRRSKNLASLVTFGSPVDLVAGLPLGLPAGFATRSAGFLADHVFNRIPITDRMAATGFQLLDPVKTLKSRIDFVRQLHDREALLPREQQRRFLMGEGFVPWSGPAVADVLKQFVVHNRMMSGGFIINDQVVSLAEITCPILSFVGEVDDIGQPVAVRGIRRAAPHADVYEVTLRAGHFGLVVGSSAARQTWPAVADWVKWREDEGPQPEIVHPMEYQEPTSESGVTAAARIAHTAASVVEVGAGVGRELMGLANNAMRGTVELSGEAARALPRLSRLGQIQPHTRISLGSLLAEQGRRAPVGECFLFDDRVHTNAAVNTRIDNVVRGLIEVGVRPAVRIGVLMETRPSALVTVAALSRLGAVAVLLSPGSDLAAAIDLTEIDTVVTDPDNLKEVAATGKRVLVLGGGESRALEVEIGEDIIDLEQIDPHAVRLPGWYRPNPGRARELAFILVSGLGRRLEAKYITNYRWAVSAFGTASAADLDRNDTVYCLAPLHHSSGLLVSLGGAVAGGSRIALARELDPARFAEEVERYGVSVVTYTWTMMREVLDAPGFVMPQGHPIRLFIGSGMPVGLWQQTIEKFAPARVLEFYASTEGDVVLANVAGTKIGCKGRPVPGTAPIELAAYDPVTGRLIEDPDGFVRRCEDGEVGLLLGRVSANIDISNGTGFLRGVFAQGDSWTSTQGLFRRDADGDYWLVDFQRSVVITPHGPVYAQPVVDALDTIGQVDLAVVYGVDVQDHKAAVVALTLREGTELSVDVITDAMRRVSLDQRPDFVQIVDDIPVSPSFRPSASSLREEGVPQPGYRSWYFDNESQTYQVLTDAVRNDFLDGPA